MRNFGDDPKIRLLNRLYEKKRRVRALVLFTACTLLRRWHLKQICTVSARTCGKHPCNTDLCTLVLILDMLMGTASACRKCS